MRKSEKEVTIFLLPSGSALRFCPSQANKMMQTITYFEFPLHLHSWAKPLSIRWALLLALNYLKLNWMIQNTNVFFDVWSCTGLLLSSPGISIALNPKILQHNHKILQYYSILNVSKIQIGCWSSETKHRKEIKQKKKKK